jgi:hypothetical protein
VLAATGETVAIGGLISKSRSRQENKIPWLGDLPIVGAAFRYCTETQSKRELLVILTPHILRCPADAERIALDEMQRINWIESDVQKVHGPFATPRTPPPVPSVPPGPVVAPPGTPIPILPQPQPQPQPPADQMPPAKSAAPTEQPLANNLVLPPPNQPAPVVQAAATAPAAPPANTNANAGTDASPKKESRGWNPFRRKSQ